MCYVCVILRFGQTPPLISGTVDLERHSGSICFGVDCLSACRWAPESSATGLSAIWQTGQKKRPILSTWERGAARGEIAGRENESEKDREKKRAEKPKGEVMCESHLSYLMAYPRFLVLSICHWVNQDLWASSPLQILIMLLQIKSDTQVLKGVCMWPDGLIFHG